MATLLIAPLVYTAVAQDAKAVENLATSASQTRDVPSGSRIYTCREGVLCGVFIAFGEPKAHDDRLPKLPLKIRAKASAMPPKQPGAKRNISFIEARLRLQTGPPNDSSGGRVAKVARFMR
jgi:hypothetical protein